MIYLESKIDMPQHIKHTIQTLLSTITDKDLVVQVRKWTNKRSLDANRYYWTLTTKLAEINGISKARQHNLLLRDYGQDEVIGEKLVKMLIPDTEEAEIKTLESAEYHIRPTSQVITGKDGIAYRNYIMLRGSSTYNTKEMAGLISGLIAECRQMEIPEREIMTPNEKEELRQKWGIDL